MAEAVSTVFSGAADPAGRLSFAAADLSGDDGWAAASPAAPRTR